MIAKLIKYGLRWMLIIAAILACGVASSQEVIRFVHTDALGSPVAYSDASGSIVERLDYEPYGESLSARQDGRPGYAGHVSDGSTGLSYMQQRYYDPAVGRFLSADPVTAHSNPLVLFNRFKYAANNPYTFVDPDGREEEAWAQLGDALRFEFAKRSYRNETDPGRKAAIADRLAFESRVKYGDRSSAQRYQLEADTLRGAPEGIIYKRIDPRTGDIYIGRSNSPENYQSWSRSRVRSCRSS